MTPTYKSPTFLIFLQVCLTFIFTYALGWLFAEYIVGPVTEVYETASGEKLFALTSSRLFERSFYVGTAFFSPFAFLFGMLVGDFFYFRVPSRYKSLRVGPFQASSFAKGFLSALFLGFFVIFLGEKHARSQLFLFLLFLVNVLALELGRIIYVRYFNKTN